MVKRIVLTSDGASRGNPGPAGAGAIIEDVSGKLLRELSVYLGHTTNNVAEYRALILGLQAAEELGAGEIEGKLDSKLLVNQLTGRYRVRSVRLAGFHQQAKNLLKNYERVDIKHIPRQANRRADGLAQRAIKERSREEISRGRIVVVGSSNTDMVVHTRRLPAPGETVLGGKFLMAQGGKGANQAVAVARLGGQVGLVGRVGQDVFGQRTLGALEQEGVETGYIVQDSEVPSGIALIWVDARGQNSIVVAPGANGRLSPEDVERARPAFEEASAVLLQLEVRLEALQRAVELGKAGGALVLLNPAPAQRLDAEFLAGIDIIVPNETEAAQLVGLEVQDVEGAAGALLDMGPRVVIITLWERGAFLATRERSEHIPAYLVEAVDTTAAGDAFCGGLAWALVEGYSLPRAVRFACAAGAVACTRLGAQPSLPAREEIEQMLQVR